MPLGCPRRVAFARNCCLLPPVLQLRAAFLAADGASALRELLDNPSDRVSWPLLL